jgi:hypothetical protein
MAKEPGAMGNEPEETAKQAGSDGEGGRSCVW